LHVAPPGYSEANCLRDNDWFFGGIHIDFFVNMRNLPG